MGYAVTPWGLFRRYLGQAPTAVTVDEAVPAAASLRQNWPNPFNSVTTIEWTLPTAGTLDLMIYDILGRPVRTLACGPHAAGAHRVTWDGLDESGAPVASGVYFCRLTAPGLRLTRRIALVK